jgi:type III restriction enzyme
VDAVQEPEAKEIIRAAVAQLGMQESIMASPAERQERFAIPQMMLELNGEILPADEGIWLEAEWSPPLPPRKEDIPALGQSEKKRNSGIIDVVDGVVVTLELPEVADRMRLIEVRENWDAVKLVSWLDRNIRHDDLDAGVARAWFDAVVHRMKEEVPHGRLVRERFDLRRSLEAVLAKLRREARRNEYQMALFGEHHIVKVRVGGGYNFVYDPNAYPARWNCKRSGDFTNHYYDKVGELETETEKRNTPEEFLCAQYIDEQPGIEWWVRNLDKQPVHSFWLQTSTDKFYPDFVAKLLNGKILVVEYKGEDRSTNDDTKEKERLGKLWEERSGGLCFFEMVKGPGELRKIQESIKKACE